MNPRLAFVAVAAFLGLVFGLDLVKANPDAKRLYDDLLSNYNK